MVTESSRSAIELVKFRRPRTIATKESAKAVNESTQHRKGNPVARRIRKATGLIESAELPN